MGSEKESSNKHRHASARINVCCCPPGGEQAVKLKEMPECCGPMTVNIWVTPAEGCCDDSAECCPPNDKK